MFWLFYPFYNWGFVPFFFLTVDLSVLMSPKLGGSWPVADVCFYRPVSGAEATLRTEDSQLPHRLCQRGRLVLCRRKMPKNDLLDMIKIHWKQLSKYRYFNMNISLTKSHQLVLKVERKLSRNYLWNYPWELQFSVFKDVKLNNKMF